MMKWDLSDYRVEKCAQCLNAFMDASGNHAASGCPTAVQPVHTAHTSWKRCLAKFCGWAGMTKYVEPATYNLFKGQYPREVCAKAFPKQTTKKYLGRLMGSKMRSIDRTRCKGKLVFWMPKRKWKRRCTGSATSPEIKKEDYE